MNEKFCILINISLKFVPKVKGSNEQWRQAIIWTNADTVYWRIYSALGGDELA